MQVEQKRGNKSPIEQEERMIDKEEKSTLTTIARFYTIDVTESHTPARPMGPIKSQPNRKCFEFKWYTLDRSMT